jgi:hypothetical protein
MLDMAELTRQAPMTVPVELSCTTGRQTFNYALGDGVGAFNWPVDVASLPCAIDYVEVVELVMVFASIFFSLLMTGAIVCVGFPR